MKKFFLILFLLQIPRFLQSDTMQFQDGKVIDNVKINFQKDTIEILYENGKKVVKKKTDLKKVRIKLNEVTWNSEKTRKDKNKKELVQLLKEKVKRKKIEEEKKAKEKEKEKELEEENVESNKPIPQNIEGELALLEELRELNFPMSPKIVEERKLHDVLMKERVRLQYTEGLLSYSGGQLLYTEIMEKNSDRYYVKNQFGLFYFTSKDFGEEIIIETDNGKEEIPISKVLAVKDEIYLKGFIYLVSGEKFRGKILKILGDQIIIEKNSQEVRISASDILFPKIPKENPTPIKINIAEGENGIYVLANGQSIDGKLIKITKNYLIIETSYGTLEVELSNLLSVNKSEGKK